MRKETENDSNYFQFFQEEQKKATVQVKRLTIHVFFFIVSLLYHLCQNLHDEDRQHIRKGFFIVLVSDYARDQIYYKTKTS